MPSIPQSLLWISLVVLWLFVLVPMLINKRDTVRRTSDVALSTRVLNGGMRSRLRRRSGPATGHRHDPLWAGDGTDLDDEYDECEAEDYEDAVREAVQEARTRSHTRTVMVVASVTETTAEPITEPVYLDVDVVDENSGALPVGGGVQESLFDAPVAEVDEPEAPVAAAPEPEPEPEPEPQPQLQREREPDLEREPELDPELATAEPVSDEHEYEYVEDTSGLEAADEPDDAVTAHVGRRRRLESTATAEAVTARKYRFRKRALTVMAALMVLTAVLSFTVSSASWWFCGATAAVTVLYLAYLRRQTRIEEQVRRRRQQRMARQRRDEGAPTVAERPAERDVDDLPSRLRRPGTVVLDIDDEDPIFEHLDEVRYSRRYDLPRAAGQ
jgi:hypothetical protein